MPRQRFKSLEKTKKTKNETEFEKVDPGVTFFTCKSALNMIFHNASGMVLSQVVALSLLSPAKYRRSIWKSVKNTAAKNRRFAAINSYFRKKKKRFRRCHAV
jgi:hypothetical protein